MVNTPAAMRVRLRDAARCVDPIVLVGALVPACDAIGGGIPADLGVVFVTDIRSISLVSRYW